MITHWCQRLTHISNIRSDFYTNSVSWLLLFLLSFSKSHHQKIHESLTSTKIPNFSSFIKMIVAFLCFLSNRISCLVKFLLSQSKRCSASCGPALCEKCPDVTLVKPRSEQRQTVCKLSQLESNGVATPQTTIGWFQNIRLVSCFSSQSARSSFKAGS